MPKSRKQNPANPTNPANPPYTKNPIPATSAGISVAAPQNYDQDIGAYVPFRISFPHLDEIFSNFKDAEFKKRSTRKRFHRVNQVLLQLVREAPKHSFLLPSVVEYIERVNREHVLAERYHLSLFEFWLNHFSELTEKEQAEVRSKIVGKYIPRGEYQAFFPIGMNKTFTGTHFIAAHLSPDVDTMIASFWGWADAFAARVGNAQHIWSLPVGPPDSPVTQMMRDFFGAALFTTVANTSETLTLTALDLVTQRGFLKKRGTSSISTLELNAAEQAVIHVDENGYYLGDWHSSDVEPVRKIILRFKSCLRWFENNLHAKLISLFAKPQLHVSDIAPFLSSVFDVPIRDCEPAKEFTDRQKKLLHDFFVKVLGLEKGIDSTFAELNQALATLSIYDLKQFQEELESLPNSDLFDENGHLREDRPAIFRHLEKMIDRFDKAIHYVRDYAEQLDVAMHIKRKVLDVSSEVITMRGSVEDMHIIMKNKEYITVVIPEEGNKLFPVGVIWAAALQKPALGTVTFRDFSNQEEVKMAPYLIPISVIDHHKMSLKTSSPPMALIADSQSCNVLIAELTMGINSRYSLGGMSPQVIESEIMRLRSAPITPQNLRILQRLLQRHIAIQHCQAQYYVDSDRELGEYLFFIHAILDDTDLLTKVSLRDITCVVELLNRIKSLVVKQDVEIINLDDIPRDDTFVSRAVKYILKNPEMYSIYRKVFETKELEMDKSLKSENESDYATIYLDTKEQNGCCRIGQTKIFTSNYQTYRDHATKLIQYWLKNAQAIQQKSPEIDLHLHMISTVASAHDVYEDKAGEYQHQDEMWFWVPQTQKAYDHLNSFLTAFQTAHQFGANASLEFLDSGMEEVKEIFERNCSGIPIKLTDCARLHLPVAILRFKAGFLNSRKAMVSPYLPRAL
jgi:hypothetical protein